MSAIALPDGVPKSFAGSTAFGVEKSMSSAVARTICIASFALSVIPSSSAALCSRPMIPDEMPVASDEQLDDDTDTKVRLPKLVHPLSAR